MFSCTIFLVHFVCTNSISLFADKDMYCIHRWDKCNFRPMLGVNTLAKIKVFFNDFILKKCMFSCTIFLPNFVCTNSISLFADKDIYCNHRWYKCNFRPMPGVNILPKILKILNIPSLRNVIFSCNNYLFHFV